jgi:hypothetical protein
MALIELCGSPEFDVHESKWYWALAVTKGQQIETSQPKYASRRRVQAIRAEVRDDMFSFKWLFQLLSLKPPV